MMMMIVVIVMIIIEFGGTFPFGTSRRSLQLNNPSSTTLRCFHNGDRMTMVRDAPEEILKQVKEKKIIKKQTII